MKRWGLRRAGIDRKLASRMNQMVWRWFIHIERMAEDRTAWRILMMGVSGRRVRGRPGFGGWMVCRWPWVVNASRWRLHDDFHGAWWICRWLKMTRLCLLGSCVPLAPSSGSWEDGHLVRGSLITWCAGWRAITWCGLNYWTQGAGIS